VYRKQVRRRRAVLALLIITSFALLTATFGERSGGLQNGVSTVLGPLQEGADRALKPARDLINWFDETFEARGENDRLQAEVEKYREQAVGAEVALHENEQLKELFALQRSGAIPSGYEQVVSRIIGRSPTVWYGTVQIDKGTSEGIEVGDPVTGSGGPAGGLVGTISSATAGTAKVTLITDPAAENAVTAKIVPGGAQGVVSAEVGDPDELKLDFIDSAKRIARGDDVVSAGWRSTEFSSRYPPNIPIGEVTEAPIALQEASQEVRMRPFADMRELDFIMVLTGGSR
jgi:rod shape-determining protein MreC